MVGCRGREPRASHMYILAHERGTLAHPAPHFPSFRAAKTQKEKPRPPDGGNGGMTVLPVCYRWAESNCPLASTMASPPPACSPAAPGFVAISFIKLYQNFINFDTGRLNEICNFVLCKLYTISPLCLIHGALRGLLCVYSSNEAPPRCE